MDTLTRHLKILYPFGNNGTRTNNSSSRVPCAKIIVNKAWHTLYYLLLLLFAIVLYVYMQKQNVDRQYKIYNKTNGSIRV